MTWLELSQKIQLMTGGQIKTDATVYDCNSDDFFTVKELNFNVGSDVLDDKHPYLSF